MKPPRSWPVDISQAAASDLAAIAEWTAAQFGAQQAECYADTLNQAILSLRGGPSIPGARSCDDLKPGLLVLHVARRGRKGRHLIAFRVSKDGDREFIEILRVLHDAMDLPRHLTRE